MTNSNTKRQTRKVGVAGGFINQMMGNNSTQPEVGKGATILLYSDRSAYEVIEVSEDGMSCVIRAMSYKHIGESYGDEQYIYSSDENNHTYNLEWNSKKGQWGKVWKEVKIIKALVNRLVKQYGYGWSDYLDVPYKELIDGEENGINTKLKLVKGITKEYKEFSKVSIIFGVMERYQDPSF